MSRNRMIASVIVIVSVAIFASLVSTVWPFTTDDSFITFRYAENLATGYGPTFNPGGPPVEGYTSFLWMVVMAVPHWAGWDAVLFSKVFGVAAMALLGLVSFRFVVRLTDFLDAETRWVAAAVTTLMLASFVSTSIHAVSGMETALFALLLQSFLFAAVSVVDRPSGRRFALLAMLGLLTGLTRPEGNLPVAVGLVMVFLFLPRMHRRGFAVAVLCGYVVPGAGYFLWRWGYYGLFAPLSFYVKVASPSALPGKSMVGDFVLLMCLHAGVLVVLGAHLVRAKAWVAIVPVCLLVGFFMAPAPIMNYAWRYLFPAVPLLFVLAGVGTGHLITQVRTVLNSAEWAVRFRTLTITAGICVVLCIGLLSKITERTMNRRIYARGLNSAHILLGKRLNVLKKIKHSPVLAISDAGAVPYYSQWETIDTYGLNDVEIARSGKHDPQYVLGREPDVVVLISRSLKTFRGHMEWEDRLYHACLEKGMVRVGAMTFKSRYYLWIMVHPDHPMAEFLRTAD